MACTVLVRAESELSDEDYEGVCEQGPKQMGGTQNDQAYQSKAPQINHQQRVILSGNRQETDENQRHSALRLVEIK